MLLRQQSLTTHPRAHDYDHHTRPNHMLTYLQWWSSQPTRPASLLLLHSVRCVPVSFKDHAEPHALSTLCPSLSLLDPSSQVSKKDQALHSAASHTLRTLLASLSNSTTEFTDLSAEQNGNQHYGMVCCDAAAASHPCPDLQYLPCHSPATPRLTRPSSRSKQRMKPKLTLTCSTCLLPCQSLTPSGIAQSNSPAASKNEAQH
jgi:hypothetical protein